MGGFFYPLVGYGKTLLTWLSSTITGVCGGMWTCEEITMIGFAINGWKKKDRDALINCLFIIIIIITYIIINPSLLLV